MCLLFAILTLLGPRALVFFWWILEPARWAATFQSAFIPVIGFLFLPWTTIMYVLVFPGGIEGLGRRIDAHEQQVTHMNSFS